MKKLITVLLAIIMCVSLCACESNETINETIYQVADTVQSDLVKFTLEHAQLAIELDSRTGTNIESNYENYMVPKEYVAGSRSPFVANTGHILISITYTAENIGRSSVEFDGTFNPTFVTVEYNGEEYTPETHYGCKKISSGKWVSDESGNTLLLATGDTATRRCYVDIPVEPAEDESVFVTFSLPNSSGETDDFKFEVTY